MLTHHTKLVSYLTLAAASDVTLRLLESVCCRIALLFGKIQMSGIALP